MFKAIRTQIDQFDNEMNQLGTDHQDAEYRLLQFYVHIVPRVMNVERCSIFIASKEEGGPVWLQAGTGVNEREIVVNDLENSIVGEAIRTGKAIYRTDLAESGGVHKDTDQATGFVTRDILCMPIRSLDGKRITGAVQLLNKEGGASYTEAETALLTEMLQFLERSIESMYVRQEASGLVNTMYKALRRVTLAAMFSLFAMLAALSVYWFAILAAAES